MWMLTQNKDIYFYCERFELVENVINLYYKSPKIDDYISQQFDSNKIAKQVFNDLVMKHASNELEFCAMADSHGNWIIEAKEESNDAA